MSNQVDLSSLTNLENLVANFAKLTEQDVKEKNESDNIKQNCQSVSLGFVNNESYETNQVETNVNVPSIPIKSENKVSSDNISNAASVLTSVSVLERPPIPKLVIKREHIQPFKKTVSEVIDITSDSDEEESNNVKTEEDPAKAAAAAFAINMASIPTVPKENQNDELWNLGITVYDQSELEEGVMAQVESSFQKQELERKKKQVEKDLPELDCEMKAVRIRLCQIDKALSMAPKEMNKEAKRKVESIKREKENKLKQLKRLEVRKKSLLASVGQQLDPDDPNDIPQNYELDNETKFQLQKVFQDSSESLIRSGEMTPFGTVMSNVPRKAPALKTNSNELTDFEKFLLDQSATNQKTPSKVVKHRPSPKKSPSDSKNNVNKLDISKKKTKCKSSEQPSTATSYFSQPSTSKNYPPLTVVKSSIKCKTPTKVQVQVQLGSQSATGTSKRHRPKRKPDESLNVNYKSDPELSDYENGDVNYDDMDTGKVSDDDDDYVPEMVSDDSDNDGLSTSGKKRKKCDLTDDDDDDDEDDEAWVSVKKNKGSGSTKTKNSAQHRVIDDGNEKSFIKRMKSYNAQKMLERHKRMEQGLEADEEPCVEFDGGLKVPQEIWDKLFRYQQTGVRWLWELHQQNCGGIIGDEMGLGKTIQIIAFFAALKASELRTDGDKFTGLGPTVLVCPATVMHQWVKEFHKWYPPIRVAVLHESGSYNGKRSTLIRYITNTNGVLITSYQGLTRFQNDVLAFDWHYIVLDEGHKIRNPDAQVTLACKQFRTPHRIILSGSPMQNNLKELWSLFDFVFPGKLGTLPTFMQEFSVPITQGGYSNASEVQVQTAYKCAVVLRNTIKPYLLRRMKSDVQMALQLPDKNEQVLFCKLTQQQRDIYKAYLATPEIGQIVDGKFQIFVGLIALRKICNHPDIFDGGPKIFRHTDVSLLKEEEQFGYYKRSGKMVVVDSLLRLWKQQGHRVLLFTQSRQMLKIFQIFMEKRGYTYMSLDGTVNIAARQPAINKFNSDESIFVFLLTTKVGGLGVNLTGANRIIIYDPDWNPSTDVQARERAWRIGQQKQVTIYRLLTSGTIEEKIYHRQIFKQFLTNRVLKDPRQRRFFKTNDLYELFTLGEDTEEGTETSAIFAGTGSEVKLSKKVKKPKKESSLDDKAKKLSENFTFSSEKQDRMKEIAKRLSQKIAASGVSGDSKVEVVKDGLDTQASDVLPVNGESSEAKKIEKNCDKKSIDKKDKKLKKKKKRNALDGIEFEGQKIDYLLKKEIFRSSNEDDETHDMKQDEYLLSKLFKKSAVQTALKHDTIIDAADPDYLLVEGEAERVAREAVQALKRSRRQCEGALSGIPTWTGVNGSSGAPTAVRKRFGQKKNSKLVDPNKPLPSKNSEASTSKPSGSVSATTTSIFGKKKPESLTFNKDKCTVMSSAELLAKIRDRNPKPHAHHPNDSSSSDSETEALERTSGVKQTNEYDELLCDIRNFLAFQSNVNGQGTTVEVIQAFKDKIPAQNAPVFKALLSKICDFVRSSNGDGVWRLKPKFR